MRRYGPTIGGLVLLASSVGCYDSASLVEYAQTHAAQKRLEEVPLGEYRITLPLEEAAGTRTEVSLKLVGTTVHYKQETVETTFAKHAFRIRQATLTAVRQTTPAELADPELTALRQRILAVTNAVLKEERIDTVAIADLRLD